MTLETLITTFFALTIIIVARYFMIAGLFYWLLWKRPPEKVHARRLTRIEPAWPVVRNEIKWSIVSSAIYAVPGAIMLEAWENGGTAIYNDVSQFGWPYLVLSVFIYLFIHDTYFYWTHRLMHIPAIYKVFHRVHHQSKQPTPWAAFSFHPYESIVGAIIIPALVFVVPIHVGAVLFLLVLMTVCSVINHTGFEIFPDSWMRGFFGRHVITAAHHNLHHTRFRCNYALYFRFWDKVMKTDVFEEAYEFLAQPTRATPANENATGAD